MTDKDNIVVEDLTPEEKVEMKDLETIEDKIGKGEELTPEEQTTLGKADAPVGDIETPNEETEETDDAEKKSDKAPEKEEGEEKPKDEPADKAKESDDPAKDDDAEVEEEGKQKVEEELEKPEGKQDLAKFNKNETALYWDLKRERRGRQKAEAERDLLRFDKAKDQKKVEPAKEEEEEEDMFADRDDDDFLSVAEAKKLVQSMKKAPALPAQQGEPQVDPVRLGYVKMCDDKARETFDDYNEVMECGQELLDNSVVYQVEVARAVQQGLNPAVVAYNLIKGDPDFPKTLPIAQARLAARGDKPEKKETPKVDPTKAKKAKETEKKIETNQNKVKTSGHFSGGAEGGTDEFTEEQFLNMTDADFAALPKKTRDNILVKYGA